MKVNTPMRYFIASLILCTALPAAAQTTPDWAPVFKSFENGCQFDARLKRLLKPFADVDYNGAAKSTAELNLRLNRPNQVNLPAAYRRQTQPPMTLHRAEFQVDGERFLLDQTRLKLSGTYYGLPVLHLSQTFQLETAGYEFVRLLLDVPPQEAQRVLKGKYRPVRQYNLVLEGQEILQATLQPVNINGQSKTVVECAFVNG